MRSPLGGGGKDCVILVRTNLFRNVFGTRPQCPDDAATLRLVAQKILSDDNK